MTLKAPDQPPRIALDVYIIGAPGAPFRRHYDEGDEQEAYAEAGRICRVGYAHVTQAAGSTQVNFYGARAIARVVVTVPGEAKYTDYAAEVLARD